LHGDLFTFEDLTGTFSVADVTLTLVVSFVVCAWIGWVYRATHHGVSYSKSFVQTLVVMGMCVSVVMLVVGSNVARAFSLVGALSIIRFRNAIKETRDVAFVFFAMIVGMAAGTRFFILAAVAGAVISLVILMMDRFDWYDLPSANQVLKVQLPAEDDSPARFDDVFVTATDHAELLSIDSVRGGAMTELVYSVRLKRNVEPQDFLHLVRERAGGQRVTLLTGYDTSAL
jgi:hypothetical protein